MRIVSASAFAPVVLAAALTVWSAPAGAQINLPLAPRDAPITLPPAGGPPLAPPEPRSRPLSPVSPAAPTKTVLAMTAYFERGSGAIPAGVLWRVFSDQEDVNGNFPLVAESDEPQPLFTLDPGGYVIHATYGLASQTRHVVLGSQAASADIMLNAGALRLTGLIGDVSISAEDLTFTILREEDGIEQPVYDGAKPGDIVRLPAGLYQVASVYGNANSRIQVALTIEPGRITDATVHHKAARVALKLVNPGDAVAIPDASWSVLTPGGDVVSTSLGGLAEVVLAEGDYVAVAQHDGQNFQKEFSVDSGETTTVVVERRAASALGGP